MASFILVHIRRTSKIFITFVYSQCLLLCSHFIYSYLIAQINLDSYILFFVLYMYMLIAKYFISSIFFYWWFAIVVILGYLHTIIFFRPAPKNEQEMMILIFEYIDRIFSIVRPRRVLYMAIDGVVRTFIHCVCF